MSRTREQILQEALILACRRIADGAQAYHEANTPDGWAEVFVKAAETGRSTDEVLAGRPEPRAMAPAHRKRLR